MNLEFSGQFFEKYSNIKFQENTFVGIQVVPCGRTDGNADGRINGVTIKFANLILEGLFITNLYQLDKQSTKFTIWKY